MRELQHLIQSGSDEVTDFIRVIVTAAKEHLDADIAFLSEFTSDRKIIRKLSGGGDTSGIAEGASFLLKETYCYRVVEGELPNVIEDAGNDDRVNHLVITKQLDIGTYVSVPVVLSSGRKFGTLCCLYHQADATVLPRDVRFLQVLANIISTHLARHESINEDYRSKRERVQAIIDQQAMRMVFQPIVDISTREVVGVEALARFEQEPRRTPDVWFAEAWEVRLGSELELAAVRAAIARFPELPESVYMSFNVSPETLQTEAFFELLEHAAHGRLVAEVTEHRIVDAYEPLLEAIHKLKASGIRLAVDDAGAGYSGLSHIIRVTPKILKLDISLTRDIHNDVVKQALAIASVAFASRVDMDIVAEGVETEQDANTLQQVGVRYGQGYLFGKPAPLPLERLQTK